MDLQNRLLAIIANVAEQRDEARVITNRLGTRLLQVIAFLYAVSLVESSLAMQIAAATAFVASIVVAVRGSQHNRVNRSADR